MISSIGSSARRALLLALVAAACAGCVAGSRSVRRAGAPKLPSPPPRLALLPLENKTGEALSLEGLRGALQKALTDRGVEIVSGAELDAFLARHRVRNVGGVDEDWARAAGAELGVSGVLVGSASLHRAQYPPALGLTLRLVSTDAVPELRWIDGAARAAEESPGPLDLNVERSLEELRKESLRRLADSLVGFLAGTGAPPSPCALGTAFFPRTSYRSASFQPGRIYSVAVLPFVNDTELRYAGDVVALELVHQFAATQSLRVVEPGRIRRQLLGQRWLTDAGGVLSPDIARMMLDRLDADLLVTGRVRAYRETAGADGEPAVEFAVSIFDRESGDTFWQSISYNEGDDAVVVFDLNKVRTAAGLSCRMARGVAEKLVVTDPATLSAHRHSRPLK